MSRITREKCAEIRDALNKALSEIEGLDVSFELGNFTFNETTVNIKMTATAHHNGKIVPQAEMDYIGHASKFGLKQEWFGKTIRLDGESFTIKGLKPKARKNTLIIENSRGKQYVCSHHTAITQLS